MAAYLHALAAGGNDAVGAAFELGGYVRDANGGRHTLGGPADQSARDEGPSSTDEGVLLEPCGLVDYGCGILLEYNVIPRGGMPMLPQAGAAVFVPGHSGKLASVRLYDGLPPLGPVS